MRSFRVAPREVILEEVNVRGGEHFKLLSNPNEVRAGAARITPKVDAADPFGLKVRFAQASCRLNRDGAATEGHDGHDPRLVAGDELVRRLAAIWWPGCSVEDVHGVRDGVIPEAGRATGRDQLRPYEVEDRADGTFGYAIQLVHVSRARTVRHELGVKQLVELVRE